MNCSLLKRIALGLYIAAIIPAVVVWVWVDFLVVQRGQTSEPRSAPTS